MEVDRDSNIQSARGGGRRTETRRFSGSPPCLHGGEGPRRSSRPVDRVAPRRADCGDVTSGRASRAQGRMGGCGGISVVGRRGTVGAG